ncbi:hypothetical protein HYH03_001570 [Edaphochlamys debaryana]|uniref:Uncharacterized protein n=1 Tax=Edaphochlamys debaryana TaxID=47281 RepID=A0A835YDP6_9CHLO|nr:hypothetical protein HYH03_001570 [Edaphochlamys debaryana]|eukprot:KAG2500808.1 hypothetical protein HYH03_001570 [Edaphochlamys debaryana]
MCPLTAERGGAPAHLAHLAASSKPRLSLDIPLGALSACPSSLQDVLRTLPLDGLRALWASVGQHPGALPSARLACKALRDSADACVSSLELITAVSDADRFRRGWRPPPLSRWPHLRHLRVLLTGDPSGDAVGPLLLLPLLHQPAEARGRVHTLALADRLRASSELRLTALCGLGALLPSLRRLDLSGLRWESCGNAALDAAELSAVYASAPQSLRELRLPCMEMLEGVEALSGSLTHLRVQAAAGGRRRGDDAREGLRARFARLLRHAAGLPRLTHLSLTHLDRSAEASALNYAVLSPVEKLTAALDVLAPAFAALTLHVTTKPWLVSGSGSGSASGYGRTGQPVSLGYPLPPALSLTLRAGSVRAVAVVGEAAEVGALGGLAQALLASPALPSRLPRLEAKLPAALQPRASRSYSGAACASDVRLDVSGYESGPVSGSGLVSGALSGVGLEEGYRVAARVRPAVSSGSGHVGRKVEAGQGQGQGGQELDDGAKREALRVLLGRCDWVGLERGAEGAGGVERSMSASWWSDSE